MNAGGVPAAAHCASATHIAERFDARYGDALDALAELRRKLLGGREGRCSGASVVERGHRRDFCDSVEQGGLTQRLAHGSIVVGVSHHGAPLDVRERLAFATRDVMPALERLRAEAGIAESVVLSTCNRTELYLVEGEREAAPAAWALLSERLGADASGYGYVRRDREAAAHLFRVASGLDSMVVGEAQIHGQVRDAWEACRPASGAMLNRLFQSALLDRLAVCAARRASGTAR